MLHECHETASVSKRRRDIRAIYFDPMFQKLFCMDINLSQSTGVNPAGDAGDTSPPIFWLGGRQWEYPPQYYYICSDIADQY